MGEANGAQTVSKNGKKAPSETKCKGGQLASAVETDCGTVAERGGGNVRCSGEKKSGDGKWLVSGESSAESSVFSRSSVLYCYCTYCTVLLLFRIVPTVQYCTVLRWTVARNGAYDAARGGGNGTRGNSRRTTPVV